MTISEAIEKLLAIKDKYWDVQIKAYSNRREYYVDADFIDYSEIEQWVIIL